MLVLEISDANWGSAVQYAVMGHFLMMRRNWKMLNMKQFEEYFFVKRVLGGLELFFMMKRGVGECVRIQLGLLQKNPKKREENFEDEKSLGECVRIQCGLLQSPLITLLIVKASPPLQTTQLFCVNTDHCQRNGLYSWWTYQRYPPTLCTPNDFLEMFLLWCPLVIAHICPVAKGLFALLLAKTDATLQFLFLCFITSDEKLNTKQSRNYLPRYLKIWNNLILHTVSCFLNIIFKSVINSFVEYST